MKLPDNPFLAALRRDETQIGLWLALANPYAAEIVGGLGFDWLLIDGEHAPNDVRSTLAQLQAIASAGAVLPPGRAPSHPVVRVPVGKGDVGTALIKQYLDIGAQTLLVPMVDAPEQAAHVVRAAKYPPEGIRGMGAALARASRWQAYPDYVHEANAQVAVLVQAETTEAMQHLDAIAATPGVDGVFIGPADLSASMGYVGQPGHPAVQQAILSGIERIRRAGKAPGILASDREQAHRYLDAGAVFVAVGVDTSLLVGAAQSLLADFQGDQGSAMGSASGKHRVY